MGASSQSARIDKHHVNEWCGLIFSAKVRNCVIARWAELLREFQFELDVCKIFLLATEIRNRQRIRGQPCVRKCELD